MTAPLLTSDGTVQPSLDLYDRIFTPDVRSQPTMITVKNDSPYATRLQHQDPNTPAKTPLGDDDVTARKLRNVKSAAALGEAKRHACYTEAQRSPSIGDWDTSMARARVHFPALTRRRSPPVSSKQFVSKTPDAHRTPSSPRQRTTSATASGKPHSLLTTKRWSAILTLRSSKESNGARSPSSSSVKGPGRRHVDAQTFPGTSVLEISSPYAVTAAPDSALMTTVAAAAAQDNAALYSVHRDQDAPHAYPRLKHHRSMESTANGPMTIALVRTRRFDMQPQPVSLARTSFHTATSDQTEFPHSNRETDGCIPMQVRQEMKEAVVTGGERQHKDWIARHTSNSSAANEDFGLPFDEEAYLSIAVGEPSAIYTSSVAAESSMNGGDTWSTPQLDNESSFEYGDEAKRAAKLARPLSTTPPPCNGNQSMKTSHYSHEARLQSFREFAIHSPTRCSLSKDTHWPEREVMTGHSGSDATKSLGGNTPSKGKSSAAVVNEICDRQNRDACDSGIHHARFDFLRQQEKYIMPPAVGFHGANKKNSLVPLPEPTRLSASVSLHNSFEFDDDDCEGSDDKGGNVEYDAPTSDATYDTTSLSEHEIDRAVIRTAWRGQLDGFHRLDEGAQYGLARHNNAKVLRHTRALLHPSPNRSVQ